MERYIIKIDGITPLICHRFSDEAAMKSSSGSRVAAAAAHRGTPQDIAQGFLYYGLAGNLIIPQPNLLRCLVDGGRFFKAGKAQITSNEKSLLYSCLDIPAAEIPLLHTKPWRVDTRAVVIPSTKGRVLQHRPMFDDWALEFEVELDETILDAKLLRDIVDAAGKRVGLGDFRPARKGPYGKFVVTKWNQSE